MNDMIPEQLADIHNHLVPSVDDGCRSLDESLTHLRALRAEGVLELATSSHLNGWLVYEGEGALAERLERLRHGFELLSAACESREDVPRLRFSQEILTPTPDVARKVFATAGVGLNGTSYALCEFGFDPEGDTAEVVRAVGAAGKRIIIAHPERYRLQGQPIPIEQIRQWNAAGALLQVNGSSLLGEHGPGHEALGWRMVEEGLADLAGTDHHGDYRPVSPRDIARALLARGAAEQANLLLSENPRRILADQETVAVPPLRAEAAA
ncbi:MAG TPA: CpsB/CapC family capsule biosynthesis tyrosine phosphatase [Longimicrobiales bacterium]